MNSSYNLASFDLSHNLKDLSNLPFLIIFITWVTISDNLFNLLSCLSLLTH